MREWRIAAPNFSLTLCSNPDTLKFRLLPARLRSQDAERAYPESVMSPIRVHPHPPGVGPVGQYAPFVCYLSFTGCRSIHPFLILQLSIFPLPAPGMKVDYFSGISPFYRRRTSMKPSIPILPGLGIHPTDTGRLRVSFPYHPDNVKRIKAVPGRRWHPEEKCWSIPHTGEALTILQRLFDEKPVQSFPQPERRPGAVTKRRWENLTAEEQALMARVEEEMKLRGYSPKTRKAYRNHLLRFRRYFDKDPQAVTKKEIRAYLLHLIDEKQVSYSSHNQSILQGIRRRAAGGDRSAAGVAETAAGPYFAGGGTPPRWWSPTIWGMWYR